jgi:hypothetical protein
LALPRMGLEPTSLCGQNLELACLPISPPRHIFEEEAFVSTVE